MAWGLQSLFEALLLDTLCPWKLEGLEYDGLCSHSPLVDLVRSRVHFQEVIKLTSEEPTEKAAKQRDSAEEKAEQKGIWDEDQAIKAAERTKLKQEKAQRLVEKERKTEENLALASTAEKLAIVSNEEREQSAILRVQILEARESKASRSRALLTQPSQDELTALSAAASASIESEIREDPQPQKRKLEQRKLPTQRSWDE